MKQGKSKTDILLDWIYNNRRMFFLYFAAAIVCEVIRYFTDVLFSCIDGLTAQDSALLAWCVWTVVFYVCMKFIVLKSKTSNVYVLMTEIAVFILVSAVLWLTRQLFVTVFFVLTSSSSFAMAMSGIFNEILCLVLMLKFVFKKK